MPTKKYRKNKSKEKDFHRRLLRSIAESAFISGDLSIEDLSDIKVVKQKLLKIFPKKDEDLFFAVDHQHSLLREGERFAKRKNPNHAYIFFATYFEHFINEIIDIWATRNAIKHEVRANLIRRLNLEDKYTWLLEILKLPAFSTVHWKLIKTISDKRNNYIHYKYKPEVATIPSELKIEEWRKDYSHILKAISYTKNYRSKVVFDGKKKKFKI